MGVHGFDAPSGTLRNRNRKKPDIQRGNGQAMTLSGVSRHALHEFAAELGANGLPGWLGGSAATPTEEAGRNNEDPGL